MVDRDPALDLAGEQVEQTDALGGQVLLQYGGGAHAGGDVEEGPLGGLHVLAGLLVQQVVRAPGDAAVGGLLDGGLGVVRGQRGVPRGDQVARRRLVRVGDDVAAVRLAGELRLVPAVVHGRHGHPDGDGDRCGQGGAGERAVPAATTRGEDPVREVGRRGRGVGGLLVQGVADELVHVHGRTSTGKKSRDSSCSPSAAVTSVDSSGARARSLASERCVVDRTVPTEQPRIRATSASGRSSK